MTVTKSGISPNLTLRLPAELRDRLEAAAGDHSISEEVRRRLEASFSTEREPVGDPQTLALADGVIAGARMLRLGLASERLSGAGARPGPWHSDPTSFEAMRVIVNRLLRHYQPEGEADPEKVERTVDFATGAAFEAAIRRDLQEQQKEPARPSAAFTPGAFRRKLRRPE